MAVLVHAAKDLIQHFWGRLPYYDYRAHSGIGSHLPKGPEHLLDVEESPKVESLLLAPLSPNESNPTIDHINVNNGSNNRDDGGLSVKVFTLNAGLIAITPHYKERMAGIISYLNTMRYDVVCLQEICFQWIAVEMIKQTKHVYPFSYFFNFGIGFPLWPGCDGTGLLLLSRFPILETFYDRYHVNGYPWALHHCDYLGSKGISFARLELPPQFSHGSEPSILNLYSTHLHAEYNDNYQARANGSADEYHAHRVAQGLQLAQFARLTSENDPHQLHLMCGDFNAPPASPILCLQGFAGFTDVMEDGLQHAEPRPTFGCKQNFFHTHGKTLPQRVDFILYRSAETAEERAHLPWRPTEAKTVCANIIDSPISLSDHNGVAATFVYDPTKTGGGNGINVRRRQPSKNSLSVLSRTEDTLLHGIDLALRHRNSHRRRGVALLLGGPVLWLCKFGSWGLGLAIVCLFLGIAELLICHYVLKDEIKVFQEKAAQVRLLIDTIR